MPISIVQYTLSNPNRGVTIFKKSVSISEILKFYYVIIAQFKSYYKFN